MKVSITFDKNVNQSNKKQWLSQISTVVEKLNNRSSCEYSPKATIKASPKASHKEHQEDQEEYFFNSACKSNTNKSQKYEKYDRDYKESIKLQQQREDRKQMQNCLVNQLLVMQKIMEDKFGTVIGAIAKLNQKVSHIEKRVSNLQIKQQQRATEQQDFNKEFAKITSKYVNMRRQSNSSFVSKNNMRETAASGFSYYLDEK